MWLLLVGAGTLLAMSALRPGLLGLGRFFSVCSSSVTASQRLPLPPAQKVGRLWQLATLLFGPFLYPTDSFAALAALHNYLQTITSHIRYWEQVKIALCQLKSTVDKADNIKTATDAVKARGVATHPISPGLLGCGAGSQVLPRVKVGGHLRAGACPAHKVRVHQSRSKAVQALSTAVPAVHAPLRRTSWCSQNLPHAQEAAAAGAQLVVLPEMWNCPYSNDSFPGYAEDVDAGASPSADALAAAAADNGVTLVGGSIPERSAGRLYNTCLVYSSQGRLLAKHRKARHAPACTVM